MNGEKLVSVTEAAWLLGVHRNTVGAAIRFLAVVTHPMPNNNAKGIDRAGLRRLRAAIKKRDGKGKGKA